MKQLFLFSLFSFLIISCSDDARAIIAKSDYTDTYIDENKEIFSFEDASIARDILTRDGCKIIFSAESFLKEDEMYDGIVNIEFLLITKREEMILSGMPTMYYGNGGNGLLASGGEFWIKAYDPNGKLLQVDASKPYTVEIPKDLTNVGESTMNLFTFPSQSIANGISSGNWVQFFGLDTSSFGVGETESLYKVIFNEFEWINCDAFLNIEDPKYKIDFIYPMGYNLNNSFAFLSLKNYPNSLARLDLRLPEDEEGQLVFVARDESRYYISIESFVATDDLEIDFSNKELVRFDLDEAANYLFENLD